MEPHIGAKIEELEKKIDLIYASVEKTNRYFLWTLIVTFVILVLPLVAAFFVIPSFIGTYTSGLEGL